MKNLNYMIQVIIRKNNCDSDIKIIFVVHLVVSIFNICTIIATKYTIIINFFLL